MTWGDLGAILAVAAALLVVLGLVSSLARKGLLNAERARKSVHLGLGCLCLSFPWVFSGPLPVVVLGLLATTALLVVRFTPRLRKGLGAGLHGIERGSLGELLFPMAVAIVFALANGRVVLYVAPILVLAVADALGALVGTRYGQHAYVTWHGHKSVEGSVLFLLAAFLCVHLTLLLGTETPRLACVVVAASVALAATAIEGMLGDGFDNFLVPVGCYAALDRLLKLGAADQAYILAAVAAMFVFLLAFRKWSTLDGGGVLAALLLGAVCLAWGGTAYLAAPLGLFISHLVVMRALRGRREIRHAADVVLALGLPSLLLLTMRQHRLVEASPVFVAHTATWMAQLSMMHGLTRHGFGLTGHRDWQGLVKVTLAIVVPALFFISPTGWNITLLAGVLLAGPLVARVAVRWVPVQEVPTALRWWKQSLAALGVGAIVLALTLIP